MFSEVDLLPYLHSVLLGVVRGKLAELLAFQVSKKALKLDTEEDEDKDGHFAEGLRDDEKSCLAQRRNWAFAELADLVDEHDQEGE
jgi:hypothetical protein